MKDFDGNCERCRVSLYGAKGMGRFPTLVCRSCGHDNREPNPPPRPSRGAFEDACLDVYGYVPTTASEDYYGRDAEPNSYR